MHTRKDADMPNTISFFPFSLFFSFFFCIEEHDFFHLKIANMNSFCQQKLGLNLDRLRWCGRIAVRFSHTSGSGCEHLLTLNELHREMHEATDECVGVSRTSTSGPVHADE